MRTVDRLVLFAYVLIPPTVHKFNLIAFVFVGKLPVQSSHPVGGLPPYTDAVSVNVACAEFDTTRMFSQSST